MKEGRPKITVRLHYDTAPVNTNKYIMTGSRSMEKGNRDRQEVGIIKGHEET